MNHHSTAAQRLQSISSTEPRQTHNSQDILTLYLFFYPFPVSLRVQRAKQSKAKERKKKSNTEQERNMSHLLALLLCAVLFAAGHSASPQWEAQSTRAGARRRRRLVVKNNDKCEERGFMNGWQTCGSLLNGLTCVGKDRHVTGKCVDNGCQEKGHACSMAGKDADKNDIGLRCVEKVCKAGHSQVEGGCQTCEDCEQGLECVQGLKLKGKGLAELAESGTLGGDWPNQGAKVQGICLGAGETGEQDVGQRCGWSAHCGGDLQCNEATHECVKVASKEDMDSTLTVSDCAAGPQ
jgi:hypothetical protein